MANELSTKWTYPLTMVSQDKRVPLPGVMDGYAGELAGVDGSVQGGLRPFGGFRTVYELNFFSHPNHNHNSFVTDFFPVNFKIDFDSYGYGFVYRAQRQTSAAAGVVEFASTANDGDTLQITSTDLTDRTYRAFSGSTHGYSNGDTGKAETRFEFLKEAVVGGTISFTSEDGFTRSYKGVQDGSTTNGTYDPVDGTVLFNVGGTDRSYITESASGLTLQSSIEDSGNHITSYSGGTGTSQEGLPDYTDTSGYYQNWEGRTTRAIATLAMTSISSLTGKTVIFEDDTKAHTITFDDTRTVSSTGQGAVSTITQVEKTAGTLNGKTIILQDAGGTNHTVTFDNTINQKASGAAATITVANVTSLNGLTTIIEDSKNATHTITFSTSVTSANSTATVAGVSGLTTADDVFGALKKSIDLAITAGSLSMTASQSASSQATLTMTETGVSGNGKVIGGTAVSGSKLTVTTFSGGNSGSSASKAGLADSDGTTLFALQSLKESIALAKTAGSIAMTADNPQQSKATAAFTFGDTEFNDANKGTCVLTDASGTAHTYSLRNDSGALTSAKAEASFTLGSSSYNSVNDASITLTDTDNLSKTFVVKNDFSAASREATAALDLGDSKFNDVNFAQVALTDASGTAKTYRIRNDAGATTSSKAILTFTFDNSTFDDENNATLTLIDTAGTTKTYQIKNDYSASASQQEFNAGANATAAAANFIALVNSSNGHNGTLVASNSSGVVTVIQNTAGATGNTTVTPSFNPHWNKLCSIEPGIAFVGGGSVEFNAGANAAVAAENLKTAINGATGHNGTLTATRDGNIVNIVQATAGSAGNTPIVVSRAFDFNDVTDDAVPTSFVGGDYIEFNAGGSRTAAGDNLASAINGSGLKIDASNSSGAITLLQEVAGSAGNTAITKSSWDDVCDANAPAAFARGGFAEFNAGASATVAATNFCIEVNKYQGSYLTASSSSGAVTIVHDSSGTAGNTSITTDSDWNSCIEGGSGGMPTAFTTGDRSTMVLTMDTVGTTGNGKAITGTGVSGGQVSVVAFASGGLGSTNAIAGILGVTTKQEAMDSLRASLNAAIKANLLNYLPLGASYSNDEYFKVLMNESGSEGEGKRITGTATGTPATGTATIGGSVTQSNLSGKTFIFPVTSHTITFDTTLSQTSSTSTKAGIKDQSTPQGFIESLHRSIELAIEGGLVMSITPPGDKLLTIKTSATGTTYNSQNFTGTSVSGGFISAVAFSGGTAGSNMTATAFAGGHDVTESDVAASEAASNLKEAIDSKMGHNSKASASVTFGDTEYNDRNYAVIELTDTSGTVRQYRIRTDNNAAAAGTALAARAQFTFKSAILGWANNSTITLVDGYEKTVTYTLKVGETADITKNEFEDGANGTAAAANFIAAVNSFYGHGGTITATSSSETVTLVQTATGTAGNTAITADILSAIDSAIGDAIPTKFYGGGALEFNVGANATAAGAFLAAAVNSASGHAGTIKASSNTGVVTLIQQTPGSEADMERAITDYGAMRLNMESTSALPAAFVLAVEANHRFTVETISTATSGATSPLVILTQKTTGTAGHTTIAKTNSFNNKSNLSSLSTKFNGGDHIMYDAGASTTNSRDNFKTVLVTGAGHSSKVSVSSVTQNSNPAASMTQATNGNNGNKPIVTNAPTRLLSTDFTGGADREGDIFLDFYHSKCGLWSYGNVLAEGVSTSEVMDVVSTGRVVVVGVRGSSPLTFYVTKPDCDASSSDAPLEDNCPTTVSNNLQGSLASAGDDCFYDYSLVIETSPGPGKAPDLQGPESCIEGPTNEEFFDAASVFITPVPTDVTETADATIVLCPNLIDEGYYPGATAIPTTSFAIPSTLFYRSDETLNEILGFDDDTSWGSLYGDSGTLITSDEEYLPTETTDVPGQENARVHLFPENFTSMCTAVNTAKTPLDFQNLSTLEQVSVGPGVYFPQPHGTQASASIQFDWTSADDCPFVVDTDSVDGSYLQFTDIYGDTHKLVLRTDVAYSTKRGEKILKDSNASASWTFIDSVEEASEITLFAANAATSITYRAFNDTNSSYNNGDLVEEGVVAFLRGDSGGDAATRANTCGVNLLAAITDASLSGHGALFTGTNSSGAVTISQVTAGTVGHTTVTSSTSSDVGSFIKYCNPIPPTAFSGGQSETYGAYVPSLTGLNVSSSIQKAFYSTQGSYEEHEAELGGVREGGSSPLAAATGIFAPQYDLANKTITFVHRMVGSLPNNGSINSDATITDSLGGSGVTITDFSGGKTDHSQGSVSIAGGAPTNGSILTLINTYEQSFTFKFDTSVTTQDGSKDASGNFIVGIKDQETAAQCARALYNVLDEQKKNIRIRPVVGTGTFTSIDLYQVVPGGGYTSLQDLDGTAWSSDERALWSSVNLKITNGSSTMSISGDSSNRISASSFSGGNSTVISTYQPTEDPERPYNSSGYSYLDVKGSFFFCGAFQGNTPIQSVIIKGRYGPKNTVFDAFKQVGTYHGTAYPDITNPTRHPSNYSPFTFFSDLRTANSNTHRVEVKGITFKNIGDTRKLPTTVAPNVMAGIKLDSPLIKMEDLWIYDNAGEAIRIINTPGDSYVENKDCRFCNNRNNTSGIPGEDGVFGVEPTEAGFHITGGDWTDDGENQFSEVCTADILTDEDISGGFNINNQLLHLGCLPGGEIYPDMGKIVESLCIYDTTTIPEGTFIDQLSVLKGFVYLYNDASIDNFAVDVMIRKADSAGEFNEPPQTLVYGAHLRLEDTEHSYYSEDASLSWTTKVDNENGGQYAAFLDFGNNDAAIPSDEFVVEVDRSDLSDNISNAQAYQVAVNISPLFSTYQWAPGKYNVTWRIRPVGIPGTNTENDSKSVGVTFTVGPNYCTYGINEEAEQVKDRKKLEAGDYVFAYQLYDSKSGRRSALSKVLEVRADSFGDEATTSEDTSQPIDVEEVEKHAILDLVYDSDKYDYAYVYRSVNTANATGTFSAGVLSMDGLIKLEDYEISGHQPTGTTDYKRAAYIYKLGDLELIYQQTYTQGSAIFDENMPFGGQLEWYDGTLLMSSINGTPVPSTDTTGTQVLESLGELRWSSMTERSPELFSPLDRFVPTIPANEIINLQRVGSSVVGFSRDRMYHIRKEGTGGYGYLRLLEMHEGFGTPGSNTTESIASTIYFLTTKGLKAVNGQGKLDDVRGFDYYIINDWAGSNLENVSMAFDPASSVLFMLNPANEEAACMWFNTARSSILKDMNFWQVKQGPWVTDLADDNSSLVERALFLQNVPSSATAADGISGYKPRICVYDHTSSKTIASSGTGEYNGQRRLTMMDGKGDTRLELLENTSHPSGNSKLKIKVTTDQVGDQWVGGYLYVQDSATASLVGNKAKILEIINAQSRDYTSSDGGDTYIVVAGTELRSLAAGDRVGVSPVYFRWVGHPVGMNSESGERFAGVDYHRTKHLEGMGASLIDVSGPPSTDSSNKDCKFRALAFSGSSLTPAEKTLIKDLNGLTTRSLENGTATYWAAFGADTSTLAMQGMYGIGGPAMTPGLEVFCPDVDFRLLSVLVTGKILSSDRLNRGTVE